jgi:hypothetical protein
LSVSFQVELVGHLASHFKVSSLLEIQQKPLQIPSNPFKPPRSSDQKPLLPSLHRLLHHPSRSQPALHQAQRQVRQSLRRQRLHCCLQIQRHPQAASKRNPLQSPPALLFGVWQRLLSVVEDEAASSVALPAGSSARRKLSRMPQSLQELAVDEEPSKELPR